ncbi:gas vesicle protein GvpO [Streptomyces sp. RPT161]|uniref:gas vesicle protein GvpO n=1 Tax=Streptomyces sp. RPT161 TaxID=3015993 RepID=UPI0022B89035|nr:gas vesicle protein [Streptomyces sp. RPT161]
MEPVGHNENEEDKAEKAHHRQHSAITARKAAKCAAEQVAGLTGRQPESVTSLERTDNGWRVGIEVVESHRIPDSTDILAVYRVEVDDRGELISYGRSDRYYRGRAEEK